MAAANPDESLQFGAFALDLSGAQLLRGGQPIHLTPKALALLQLLASRPGELVTKREIFAALWPGVAVTDFALSRCVHELRAALADEARCPRYLETVHRRGFRFVAPVARPRAGGLAHAPFVGRERELAAADEWLRRASSGPVKLLRISGEPGVGKTRLAREIARLGARGGRSVLWSATPGDEGAPPYDVWSQILARDRSALAPPAHPDRARKQAALDPLGGRQRAFETIVERLAALSAQRPVLLVLDDLHGADRDSLHLLGHLVHDALNPRLAIVCTLRDVGAPANDALARAIGGDATPERAALDLRGLGLDAVEQLLAARVGDERARQFSAVAHDKSGGNPLYLNELVELVPADPAAGALAPGVPETIRQLIARRLEPISPVCAEVLAATAVAGSEIPLALLRDVTELGASALATGIEEAVGQRLLARVERAQPRVRFCHGVMREVVYEGTTPGLRARLHRRVARALEREDGEARSASALAHHYGRALIGGDPEKAIHYALRAGEQALLAYAFEEAASHYENALDALEAGDPLDAARAARAALGAARAHALCARGGRALALASRATLLARRSRSARLFREAAVVFCELQPSYARDPRAPALLEEALARAGERDLAVRARLVALRGLMAFVDAKRAVHERESCAALALARRSGDPGALLEALRVRSLALSHPSSEEEWRRCYQERIALAEANGDAIHAFEARQHRLEHRLQRGDMAGVAEDSKEMDEIAARVRSPSMAAGLLRIRAALAIASGPVAEARRLAEQAFAAGQRVDAEESWAIAQLQIGSALGFEDRYAEIAADVRRGTHSHPQVSLFRASEIFLLTESGELAEAERRLREIARDDFAALASDVSSAVSLSNLAFSCARVGCRDLAERLLERLRPYAGRTLTLLSVYSAGCASRWLGLLASSLGRDAEADAHFETALSVDRANGARVWEAHSALEYARALERRGGAHAARARELAQRALAASERLGIAFTARGARELLARREAR
jgi:DNA-binding winged helix-turn-helix (wHTH) protein/tetratricopeptide (TPR) repeat protein